MFETFIATGEFKDSPLGKIPKDWEVKTLNSITSKIIDGTHFTPTYVEDGIPFLRVSDIHENTIDFSNVKKITLQEHRQLISRCNPQIGDILYSKNGTIGITKVVDWQQEFSIFVSLCLIKPITTLVNPLYLSRILQSFLIEQQIRIRTKQMTVTNLHLEEIREFLIPLPHLDEQHRIAEILDTLDETIAHTTSIIAKLKQIKAGLLQDLLTRGLDENGELRDAIAHPEQFKDSPLGKIPKQWSVVSVGQCITKIEQGWSPDCESISASVGEWGVLKTTAVVWEGYQDFENKRLPPHLQPIPNYEVKPGNILMTRAGPSSRVGVVAFVRNTQGKLMLSDKLYRLVPWNDINPEFLTYALSSSRTQSYLSRLKTGLAESQTNISQEIVRTLLITLPSLKEQERIITRLDAQDTRIQTEEAYLNKLKLQKKGLMDDLLTGRVRANTSQKISA